MSLFLSGSSFLVPFQQQDMEWLDKILAGEKNLEIRGAQCPHIGWVSFASTGHGMIRCRAKFGPSHPLTEEEHRQHAVAVASMGYKNPWAWPIEALELVEPPIQSHLKLAAQPSNGLPVRVGKHCTRRLHARSRTQPRPPTQMRLCEGSRCENKEIYACKYLSSKLW